MQFKPGQLVSIRWIRFDGFVTHEKATVMRRAASHPSTHIRVRFSDGKSMLVPIDHIEPVTQ